MSERSPLPSEGVPSFLTPAQAERTRALVDILYLMQVTWLYIFAAIYPFMGLFYGILLLAGGLDPKTKKIGRIVLILGIVNLALVIIAVIGIIVLSVSGLLAGMAAD